MKPNFLSSRKTCSACGGTGFLHNRLCYVCNGKGYISSLAKPVEKKPLPTGIIDDNSQVQYLDAIASYIKKFQLKPIDTYSYSSYEQHMYEEQDQMNNQTEAVLH